jgi:hypothetical protein
MSALEQLSSGAYNVAIGYSAGYSLTSGSYNIYIGNSVGTSESNTIRIGASGNQTATYIAGIYGASGGGSAVYINSDGKLGTTPSSRRYKEQIKDMDAESDVLLKLRPVSFYYRNDPAETRQRQYGLVAEEVAEVSPGLVAYEKDGTPYTVQYHLVNAMLLNEVQKQRQQIEVQDKQLRTQGDRLDVQETQIRELREQLARLEGHLAQ